jgi:methyl-accepting chemotaxis protein
VPGVPKQAGGGSLRLRIGAVVTVCVAPALIGSAVDLFSMSKMNTSLVDLDRHSVVPLASLGDLRDMEGDTRVNVWQYFDASPAERPDLATELKETDDQADSDISAFFRAHGSTTDANGRLMTEFVADLKIWRGVRDNQVLAAVDRNDKAGARAALNGPLDAANETMAGPLDKLYEQETSAAGARVAASSGEFRQARTELFVITVVGLCLAILSAYLITRRILHTVGRIATVIASGDPKVRVGPTGDTTELGAVGVALDGMFDTMTAQHDELAVAQSAREAQMNAAAIRQRLGEREVRRRAQSVVEVTGSSVLDELHIVLQKAETVRRAADEIELRAAEAERMSKSVVDSAQSAVRVVAAVSESLQRVEGITTLIAGVASQTNLLALNATIEASRAGAAGKGFAVVAGEVKGLAANTKSSTVEITDTVGALRVDAGAMSASIADMTQGVDGINAATGKVTSVATDQRQSVEELERSVRDAVDRIKSMSQLSDTLERRRHERADVAGHVELKFGGATIGGGMHDLSSSGLMCVIDATGAPREGHPVSVTLNVGEQRYEVQTVVKRRFTADDGERLGLEFVDIDAGLARSIEAFLATLLHSDEKVDA